MTVLAPTWISTIVDFLKKNSVLMAVTASAAWFYAGRDYFRKGNIVGAVLWGDSGAYSGTGGPDRKLTGTGGHAGPVLGPSNEGQYGLAGIRRNSARAPKGSISPEESYRRFLSATI
jgi:hypothetical protein